MGLECPEKIRQPDIEDQGVRLRMSGCNDSNYSGSERTQKGGTACPSPKETLRCSAECPDLECLQNTRSGMTARAVRD